MSGTSEGRLLEWLAAQGPLTRRIGDDAAILEASGSWIATMDTQIADVHVPGDLDEAVLARRLLAVNLSDLAAMGASPALAFLSLTAPEDFDHRRFFRALLGELKTTGTELAGGDLTRADRFQGVLLLLGRPGRRTVLRSHAEPGDNVWVGGPLGESAAGQRLVARGARLVGRRVSLPDVFEDAGERARRAARRAVRRHLRPEPQLELGHWLSERRRAAALDVSDGLALDASRLAEASDVGLVLEADRLPIAPGLPKLCELLGGTVFDLQLGGGEDYVLLFTLPPRTRVPEELGAVRIGHVTERSGLWLRSSDGEDQPLEPRGWDHLSVSD